MLPLKTYDYIFLLRRIIIIQICYQGGNMKLAVILLAFTTMIFTGLSIFLGIQYLNDQKTIFKDQVNTSAYRKQIADLTGNYERQGSELADVSKKFSDAEVKIEKLTSDNKNLSKKFLDSSNSDNKSKILLSKLICSDKLTNMEIGRAHV